MAYSGAKILHPSSVQPAKKENIPVRLKNTLCPDDEGTLITEDSPAKNVKAVAAKGGITAIKIKSTNMLLAYGFLRKVFEVFEAWKTPIDMIATSEVAVSLTIDCTEHLEEILKDLEKYGTIEVDRNMAIVCIVGDLSAGKSGLGAQERTESPRRSSAPDDLLRWQRTQYLGSGKRRRQEKSHDRPQS